ncbi:pentapeptide repeat-containing protein [Nocardioides sp. zg-536]|uniref:Pentapeptide repeat-containing protein n=1 Tax=Nocardioides faecalis TaxID=2803858 RepID=A0A938Y5Q5_9ACTN|nr:pentapeptide repeat-containing protein [Nocardioides faecalis]MBM9458738.1 pentapeptide repeat-containing protein [Nocardioides faecalis]QVI58722.1 pentapeptide repeat-containing protein [Nocardioides faecalis]
MPPARSATRPPRIGALRLGTLADGDTGLLRPGADLEGLRYDALDVAGLSLAGARLDGVHLTGLAADETDLSGARLMEVRLERVVLPVVRAERGQWRDVEVVGRLGSVEAWEARWRSVHLVGCKIDYLNLRGAELLDVELTDCVVGELDASQATLQRVRLRETRVERLDVRGARLTDLDLRHAGLGDIDGLLDLRGATLRPEQLLDLAPLLAAELGLRIEP